MNANIDRSQAGKVMGTVTIPEEEFVALEKKCKDQEHTIHEQDELIKKLTFGADLFEGWSIRLTQKYLVTDLMNRELVIEKLKGSPIPEGAPAELIAQHEMKLKELQQSREKALEQCNEWEDAWNKFVSTYPDAAEHILNKDTTDRKRMEK
jgi:hypothetical protein